MPPEVEAPSLVVAIDGPAGAGKTTAGVWLAGRLGVPLIESGYFFRGIAAAVDGLASLPRVDVDARVPPNEEWRPSLRLDDQPVAEPRAAEIEQKLASLAREPAVRAAIARRVADLAERRGGVVLGRRAASESCRGAPARILMTAEREVRLERRRQADARPARDRRYGARMHAREPAAGDGESNYTLKLDTTGMAISEVREVLWEHVRERLGR